MSGKAIMVNGSQFQCNGPLGAASLLGPVMLALTATGMKLTEKGLAAVLETDPSKAKMVGAYNSASHSIPGVMMLAPKAERKDQLSTKLTVSGKAVVLAVEADIKGDVAGPAMKPNPPPAPPEPDSNTAYEAAKHGQPLNAGTKLRVV